MGDTPDTLEFTDFGFHNHAQFREKAGLGLPQIGRWLGVSHQVGKLASCWILPESGTPVSATTVQQATNPEKQTDEMRQSPSESEESVAKRWEAKSPNVWLSDCQLDSNHPETLSDKEIARGLGGFPSI